MRRSHQASWQRQVLSHLRIGSLTRRHYRTFPLCMLAQQQIPLHLAPEITSDSNTTITNRLRRVHRAAIGIGTQPAIPAYTATAHEFVLPCFVVDGRDRKIVTQTQERGGAEIGSIAAACGYKGAVGRSHAPANIMINFADVGG